MVLLHAALSEDGAQQYLEATDLLPSLEIGLEDMLKACAAGDSKVDPVNFLASWLMRHNPKHNPEMAARITKSREEAAAAEAAEAAKAAAKQQRTYTTPNGQVIELEPDEEVKCCIGCRKAFITLHRDSLKASL